jgi:nitrogen fixation-related uncharacterized protein
MAFYVWWIGLTAAALWVSLAVFVWAVQAGQFSDQDRARYLPLRNENLAPPAQHEHPSRLSIEVYALMAVAGLGLFSIAMTLVLLFKNFRG